MNVKMEKNGINSEKTNNSTFYDSDHFNVAEISEDVVLALARANGFLHVNKSHITNRAAKIIAQTVEFRIRQIIEESIKFMYHSSRPTCEDILIANDIKMSLQMLQINACLGYSRNSIYKYVGSNKSFRGDRIVKRESYKLNSVVNNIISNTSNKYMTYNNMSNDVIEDNIQPMKTNGKSLDMSALQISNRILSSPKVRLIDLIYQDINKPTPNHPTISLHWLAIDGEVPNLSENLNYEIKEREKVKVKYTYKGDGHFNGKTYDKETNHNDGKNSKECNMIYKHNNIFEFSVDDNESQTIIFHKLQHFLGKEQLHFIEQVKASVRNCLSKIELNSLRDIFKFLRILKESAALQQLLPYFCSFFATEINRQLSLGCIHGASILLRFADALIQNPNNSLHHYAHQLLHPMLCVVLSNDITGFDSFCQRSLRLRVLAANVIGNLSKCVRYDKGNLERLDCTLLEIYARFIYSPKSLLHSCYGAVHGVLSLGIEATRRVLKPVIFILLDSFITSIEFNILNYSEQDECEKQLIELRLIILTEFLHLIISCFCNLLEVELSSIISSSRYSDFACKPSSFMIQNDLRHFSPLNSIFFTDYFEKIFHKFGEKFLPEILATIMKTVSKHINGNSICEDADEKLIGLNRETTIINVSTFIKNARRVRRQMYCQPDIDTEISASKNCQYSFSLVDVFEHCNMLLLTI